MRGSLTNTWEAIIVPELWNTLFMVVIATILSVLIGSVLSIALTITDRGGLKSNPKLYTVISTIVNVVRSFPFIILIVAIIPFTRLLVGTSIGKVAAIVPLTIAGSAYIAKLFETSLKEVDKSLIEAARSFGASTTQIIFKILIKESLPSLVANITLATISILGTSAMAGAVGAGGLGAIGLIYGYQNFNYAIMYTTVLILIVIVQLIQFIGNFIYRRIK